VMASHANPNNEAAEAEGTPSKSTLGIASETHGSAKDEAKAVHGEAGAEAKTELNAEAKAKAKVATNAMAKSGAQAEAGATSKAGEKVSQNASADPPSSASPPSKKEIVKAMKAFAFGDHTNTRIGRCSRRVLPIVYFIISGIFFALMEMKS